MLNKITNDTSDSTVEQSLAEFIKKVGPVLNNRDRTAILVKKAKNAGDWPSLRMTGAGGFQPIVGG
jgi:hypothetical protein